MPDEIDNGTPEGTARTAAEAGSDDERLDGWKRIAILLNRDVRTVRRWEKNQGLPIRRVMHKRGATVYAYRSELESWLSDQDEGQGRKPALASTPNRRPWLWPSLAGAALAVLVGWLWYSSQKPEIRFDEWDWVLITVFDNRTGEELLDGTLEYALQRDLGNSSYVKVVPKERVIDALQLMRLPLDTGVDEAIGREISLRDGAIRVLITGRIDKLGESYTLSASLVNPQDGVIMASFATGARDQSKLLGAISEISRDVRIALGEGVDSVHSSEQKLARVTTPSLQALKLYSDADVMMTRGRSRRNALPLLEQAVRIDPDFASAHVLISYLYGDLDRTEEANKHLERAVGLAETASERERLFILSTYYSKYLKDHSKETETNQLLARLYPDHFWATSNLASRYTLNNEFERAHPWIVRRAELRPNLGWVQIEALQSALVLDRHENVQRLMHRLGILADQDSWINAHLQLAPFLILWIKGEFSSAIEGLDRFIDELDVAELSADQSLFAHVRSLYLAMGKWDRFQQISGLRKELGWLQIISELDAGKPSSLKDYLKTVTAGDYWDSVLFTLAGQHEAAEEIIADPAAVERLFQPYKPREFINLASGQLALDRGKYQQAIEHFEIATEFLKLFSQPHYYFARQAQAQAQFALGRTDEAIETLEHDSLAGKWTIFDPGATYFWMRHQLYLLKLYRQSGRTGEAKKVEAVLRNMLRFADPEHPIMMGLEASVNSSSP